MYFKKNLDLFIYLGIYLILGLIYAIIQRLTICTDMIGYECNFSENKLISFLTISAYIITPLVAIYIFNGWKIQANYNLKQKIVYKTNDVLRIVGANLHRNHELYSRIIHDKRNNLNYEFQIDINENENLMKYSNELMSLLKELYYLTNKDKNYILFRCEYEAYVKEVSIYLKDIYNIFYKKTEQNQDKHKEIFDYLSEIYKFEYVSDVDKNGKTINTNLGSCPRYLLFNKAYEVQNDITNYILKNDFLINKNPTPRSD